MTYVLVMLVGVIGGAVSVYILTELKRTTLKQQKSQQDAEGQRIQQALLNLDRAKTEHAALEVRAAGEQAAFEARSKADRAAFLARAISYGELQEENAILKHDLQNIDVNLRKLRLDRDQQGHVQETLDQRSTELASRFLKENVKWIRATLTPTNFFNSNQRLKKVIELCRKIGFDIPAQEESTLLQNLKEEFEMVVRAAFEREEQARIRAQIREEQKLEKEREREDQQADREREAIRAGLNKALAETKDEHSAEVERWKARLAEAEGRAQQRAISRAQMTRSGHVYVISNVGSFGEGVFKIGMTRRLEPMDRVKELSSASVPFPFDVHMMISCDDAPALENVLHKELRRSRVNKAKPRKEFFRTDIDTLREIVENAHGEVQYIADAEALQYRQSCDMSDDDQEFIESVYDRLIEEAGGAAADDE